MLAARIFVRSVRKRSASLCTPSALSKSMLMLQLLFKHDVVRRRERSRSGWWVACAVSAVAGTAGAASAPARITEQVEAAARQQLQQLADREAWREPRFEI